MPRSLIEVRRPHAAHEEALTMDAVHEALVVAFGTPADDRSVRFVEHPPERFCTRLRSPTPNVKRS
jgi:hypothetical protein